MLNNTVSHVQETFYQLTDERVETVQKVAMVISAILRVALGVIVSNMALACTKGMWAIPVAVLAFLFWPLFLVYYVLSGSKCAAYW